jgi:hypothetical protein
VKKKREWGAVLVAYLVTFPCTVLAQKVIPPWEVPCREETVRPNLKLKDSREVSGQLTDATGAPFVDSQVLLRAADGKGKFVAYRTVNTNKQGRFDFGKVEAGSYRFLPAPNRGFKQPNKVTCAGDRDCQINLVLQVNPTDQEFVGCPIQ